jgi:large subunit ribosomal protein L23
MHVTEVVKKPILTEKSYLGHANGVYTFLVDRRANKVQIKKTFEEIFEVKVESVRTINYRGKATKNLTRRNAVKKPTADVKYNSGSFKKAIITLKDGEQLDVLNDL